MDKPDAPAAVPAKPDTFEGLGLHVTDKRGRQQRLAVVSEWPEVVAAATPVVSDSEAAMPVPAPPPAEPVTPDIHHIAIHMGNVVVRSVVTTSDVQGGVDATVNEAHTDVNPAPQAEPGPPSEDAAGAASSDPAAGDGSSPSDPPHRT